MPPFPCSAPDHIQENIRVVDFALHAVIIQRDDIVQLFNGNVDVGVVIRVQRDTTDGVSAGEEQVGIGRRVTRSAIILQQNAGGAGTGVTDRVWQAEVGAATIFVPTLVVSYGVKQREIKSHIELGNKEMDDNGKLEPKTSEVIN